MFKDYDIIVVGAGHAGCEAAAAAANLGSSVLLITMNMMNMAQMSCNPSMGGVAKGQIVREIDALGGYSGIVADHTMIQFRMLNRSKGPAMWSPRAQNDRMLFSIKWREILESIPNLDFWQDKVTEVLAENGRVTGVVTGMGQRIYAKAVVLTNGTFLNGIIHIGEKQFSGGRIGETASTGITACLTQMGFASNRMKTGTRFVWMGVRSTFRSWRSSQVMRFPESSVILKLRDLQNSAAATLPIPAPRCMRL
jgi:tRNA uridine 5-carboxymethylaminomethyl modification enzyme